MIEVTTLQIPDGASQAGCRSIYKCLFSFSHLANFFGALKNARIQRSVMREEAHCTDVHRCAQINKSVHLGDGRPVYSQQGGCTSQKVSLMGGFKQQALEHFSN